MRFAVSGELLPNRVDEFQDVHAARVRHLGYSGLFTRFDRDDPFATTEEQCQRVRSIVADHGLVMVQAIGHRPPLIHPDETIRRRGVATLRQAVRIAGWLGSLSCHTGPGSLAQLVDEGSDWGGAWDPHGDNWEPVCREQLVKSLKEVASTADGGGVAVGMEGHILVTLNSAEMMRGVLEEVASPAIRCDLDPVNWLTLDTVFRSGPAIDHMCDVLGGLILNAHAKDIVVEKKLTLHLDERPAGQGILDWDTFMRRVEAIGPERYLVVEHAAVEDLPVIKGFLDHKAAELGIRVLA
jgi:sugar phosphate isomerase/epimerase